MAIDRSARWLHLSDLHCPGRDDRAWEDSIASALDRLRAVRERWGTIDFVLISGDVARAGRADEYTRAARLVEEIQRRLTRDKDSPRRTRGPWRPRRAKRGRRRQGCGGYGRRTNIRKLERVVVRPDARTARPRTRS